MDRWGRGFFSASAGGDVQIKTVDTCGKRIEYNLFEVVSRAVAEGLQPPLMVRFPGIIRQRINQINTAFEKAASEFEYSGSYRLIYPIKVNQHAEVIAAVLGNSNYNVGLESGSKAELLTVIAKADNRTKILCNGFKDQAMIELAFRAKQMGRDITIVVEKLSEIALIAKAAKNFSKVPRLGLRTKLAWQGAGHWKSTNGPRSKFGLTAHEMLEAIKQLRQADLLKYVYLLHFHPGSQINDVREIKTALTEATRVYVDMVKQNVPLDTIDVGGGLAVDYTGNQNHSSSSMNYTMEEYANDVVYYIQMVCNQAGVPHPNLMSESGRAITAHHSMLVVPVFASSEFPVNDEEPHSKTTASDSNDPHHQPLKELDFIAKELDEELGKHLSKGSKVNQRFISEAYHDAQLALDTSLQLFNNGYLTLAQRAHAEQGYRAVCRRIREVLNQLEFVPDELFRMRDLLAETYFANFSVFQSLPDFWALEHLFPVMPIHRLEQRPVCRGIVGDISCDSDGQIDRFLGDSKEGDSSLLLHKLEPGKPYWLGIFLIGAYQEALSDDHNLLGKVHSIWIDEGDMQNVNSGPTPEMRLEGSSLREVIEHVNHDWEHLQQKFEQACDEALTQGLITRELCETNKSYFAEMSQSYTYLSSAIEAHSETTHRSDSAHQTQRDSPRHGKTLSID